MIASQDDNRGFASFLSAACGVIYFTAWAASFYPQVLLNYRRKSTKGFSPDFTYLNPIGFLALSIWSWAAYLSPLAKEQYAKRHHGHFPQVSAWDIAFATHALFISLVMASQMLYYSRSKFSDGEHERLLPSEIEEAEVHGKGWVVPTHPARPSRFGLLFVIGIAVSTTVATVMVWGGKLEYLDWLYFLSTVKLVISTIKWVPQVVLNYQRKSVEGFAIWAIILDFVGAIFSFSQLVISSIWIDGDASGIWANPAKLGLSALSTAFDFIFFAQRYWLYPPVEHHLEGEEES